MLGEPGISSRERESVRIRNAERESLDRSEFARCIGDDEDELCVIGEGEAIMECVSDASVSCDVLILVEARD